MGWIQSAETGATITARGASTAIAAQPGDFLFSGDRLDGSKGLITFYYCPEESRSKDVVYQLRRESQIPDTGLARTALFRAVWAIDGAVPAANPGT